jgi:hypothetical protein
METLQQQVDDLFERLDKEYFAFFNRVLATLVDADIDNTPDVWYTPVNEVTETQMD